MVLVPGGRSKWKKRGSADVRLPDLSERVLASSFNFLRDNWFAVRAWSLGKRSEAQE